MSLARVMIEIIRLSIHHSGGVLRNPACQQGHISSLKKNSQPLQRVTLHLPLVLADLSGQLPAEYLDGLQCLVVPPTPGLDGEGDKLNPNFLALIIALCEVAPVCLLGCHTRCLCGSGCEGALNWGDHRHIQCCIQPLVPVWDVNVIMNLEDYL